MHEATLEQTQPVGNRFWRTTAEIACWGLRLVVPLGGGIAGMDTIQDHWQTTAHIEAATIDAKIVLDPHGHASANVSAGSAWYDANDGPFGIRFRVNEIEENAATTVTKAAQNGQLDPNALGKQAENKIEHLITVASLKAALGFLGSAAVMGVLSEAFLQTEAARRLRGRSPNTPHLRQELRRFAIASMAVPLGALAISGGISTATMHAFSFEKLHYEGLAGPVYKLLSPTLSDLNKYKQNSAQLTTWLDNLAKISRNVTGLPGDQSNLIPILVDGDIHQRPCSYQRKELLTQTFHTAFEIDGGDLTEWGQSWEKQLFSSPACPNDSPLLLSVPEVFAKGNHDSSATLQQLQQYPNVTAPDQIKTVHVAATGPNGPMDFSITVGPDPLFTPDFANRPSSSGAIDSSGLYPAEKQQLQEQGQVLGRQALQDRPDFIVSHDPAEIDAAREVMAPHTNSIFFDFHTHAFAIIKDASNQIIGVNPGSFGGSGLRTLEQDSDQERSTSEAAIVFLDPTTKKIVWVLQLAVQNDGTISGVSHYSGEPVDTDKSERLDTFAAQSSSSSDSSSSSEH